jgi:hypothetical protein
MEHHKFHQQESNWEVDTKGNEQRRDMGLESIEPQVQDFSCKIYL